MSGFDNNWRCQHDNSKGCPVGGCDTKCARDTALVPATPPANAMASAMEAAARIEQYLDVSEAMRDLATLCAALRASQEREAQAVAAEREACAAIAEGWSKNHALKRLADTIRARKDAAP